jgi:epoxyqueuosine reductase
MSRADLIRAKALDLGFDLVGIAPAIPPPGVDAYRAWLDRGYHGEMGYLARPDRIERRENPAAVLPGVRSVVCVGLDYYPGPPADHPRRVAPRGAISNYAWGADYHELMTSRLEQLAGFAGDSIPGTGAHRVYVDTGPVLERGYAAAAGLGFIGKNTCLIHPRMGSWLFLGELLLDVELEPTPPSTDVGCGSCRRCLDACPTGALVAPYVLDARRCISYLTIERKGAIPRDLRAEMGNRIFGCDVCQEVCPFQRFARRTREGTFLAETPDRATPSLLDLVGLNEEAFRRRYEGSPILRIGRARLLRNAVVAMGNQGDERALPALADALADCEPLVRGHAAWALGRIGGQPGLSALDRAMDRERDAFVRQEIQAALAEGAKRDGHCR